MKKVVIPVLVVLALTVLINAVVPQTQQSSNPNIGAVREDSVLTAYAISPKDEEQFSVNNKSVAKFWDKLKEAGVRGIWLRGYREINPNESNRYEDEFDCQAIINAAYGQKGLYLLCKVLDNSFPGPILPDSWANDVIDFFIDPNPSNDMYAKPDQHFIMQPFQWTKTMAQFQYNFSKTGISDSIHFNVFDPSFSRETFVQTGNVFEAHLNFFKAFTHKQAKDSLGLAVNVVRLNDVTRIQEWFIPWKLLSARNKMPSVGSRFALTIEYSDVDSGNIPMATPNVSKRISWGGRGDPYNGALGSERIWGDIEFGDSIISTITVESPRTISVDDISYTYFGSNWGVQVSEKIPATIKPPKNANDYFYGFLNDRKFGQYNAPAIAFAVTKWTDQPYAALGNDSIMKASAKPAYDKFVSIKRYVIVDENGNNDLSDEKRYELKRDSDVPWNNGQPIVSSPQITLKKSQPSARVVLSVFPSPAPEGVHSVSCDRKDLLTGKISFDNKKYTVLIKPCDADNYSNINTQFWVDANQDGKFDTSLTSNPPEGRFGTGRIILGNSLLELSSIAADGSSFSYKNRIAFQNQPAQQKFNVPAKSKSQTSGARDQSNIMPVVLKNISILRQLYNQTLKSNPHLGGNITIKFSIDEFGNVLFVSVIGSTSNDPTFDKQIADNIKSWQFGKIDKPGDITEVVYPFMFQQ